MQVQTYIPCPEKCTKLQIFKPQAGAIVLLHHRQLPVATLFLKGPNEYFGSFCRIIRTLTIDFIQINLHFEGGANVPYYVKVQEQEVLCRLKLMVWA